jgi:ketosteroid isomerase-like protein
MRGRTRVRTVDEMDEAAVAHAHENRTVGELSDALAAVFSTGEVGDVFTDDFFLDGHPPYWRFQLQGIDEFTGWLEGYTAERPLVVVERTIATADGFLTEHTTREHDADRGEITARKVLICTVRDGRISEMTAYCSGDFDAALRARQAREAPMYRP